MLAKVCAHCGSPSIGKNVPATRNIGVISPLIQYEKLSIDFDRPAIMMPNDAQPKPASAAMNGTSSIPQLGSSPKTIATSNGTHPKVPTRIEIHKASPVTNSSVSTGAARIESYVCWKEYFTNVENMAGNAPAKS